MQFCDGNKQRVYWPTTCHNPSFTPLAKLCFWASKAWRDSSIYIRISCSSNAAFGKGNCSDSTNATSAAQQTLAPGGSPADTPCTVANTEEQKLLDTIRHAASLGELSSLLDHVEGKTATTLRMPLFAMFVRTAKLLLHQQKGHNRSFLQRLRSMARPSLHRPAFNLPAPGPVHCRNPTPSSHQMTQQQQQQQQIEQAELKRATPQSLLQTCKSYPSRDKSNTSVAHLLLHRLLSASSNWLPHVEPHEAAYILTALGYAHKLHPARAMPGASQMGPSIPHHSSSSMYSTDNVSNQAKHRSGSASSGASSPYEQEARVMLQALKPCLAAIKPSHLARILWGLGALGFVPCREWMQAAEHSCIANSTQFGTTSCLMLLEGLAKLRHHPHPALLTDLAHSLKPRLSWLTPAELATLLHSMAVLGCLTPPAWLHQFFQHSSSKLPGFTPTQFAQVSSALARLRYVPPMWWIKRFMHYSHRCMGSFPATELAITAHSLVRLNLLPPRAWLHDALAVLRALPPPVGAGMPKKQELLPLEQELERQGKGRGQLDQENQGVDAGQEQQGQDQQGQQEHGQKQEERLSQLQKGEQRHLEQHFKQQRRPHNNSQHRDTRASNPLPRPAQPSSLVSSNTSIPSLPQNPIPHPPPLPLFSAPKLYPPPSLSSKPPTPSTGSKARSLVNASTSSSSDSSSKSSLSATSRDGETITSSTAARPHQLKTTPGPWPSRQTGGRVHRPSKRVTTLGDTARRRSLSLGRTSSGDMVTFKGQGSGSSGNFRGKKTSGGRFEVEYQEAVRVGGNVDSRGQEGREGCDTQETRVQDIGKEMGGAAAAFQVDSSGIASDVGVGTQQPHQALPRVPLPQHTSHQSLLRHSQQDGTRARRRAWRDPAPLSPQDTYRVVYVVAKLRANPAVERHVSWAKAQLPGMLQAVGSLPASSFYAAPFYAFIGSGQQHDEQPKDRLQLQHTSLHQQPCAPQLQQLLVDHLYICAEFKYQLEADEQAKMMQLMEPLLPSFTPSNCITVVVCMAVLSAFPPPSWVPAFSQRLRHCLLVLHATDLAKALIAAAHLRLDLGPEFLIAVRVHTAQLVLVQLAALVRCLDGSNMASNVAWLSEIRAHAKRLLSSRA